ncbi:MAG: peptidase U32 family protein [Clostridia bacterium]
MSELLSPARCKESLKVAINNGCDAVYMGVDVFSARNMIKNLSVDEYIQIIEFAHMYNVKVYLTLNTLINDSDINDAISIVIKLYSHGLDAVIIQDIGILYILKKVLPEIKIHASTQMCVHNLSQVKYFEKLGFDRVVLARELTFEEIKYIKENSNIELEVFVHGALCVSFSGACLMSSVIGNRSANKGICAAPCRMRYTFYNNINKYSGYLLSKKDIYGIEYIDKLIKIGITSLKIEGRAKPISYIATVTNKYRKAINNNFDLNDEKELMQIFNRSGKSYRLLKKSRIYK